MRLKKALLFTTLIPSLVACNTSSIAGTYGFQLGKESSTHFGVYLKLTDKAYVPTDDQNLGDEKFKQFNMTVTAKTGDKSEMMDDIDRILSHFTDGLPGYYRLTDEKNREQERRIKVGFDFNQIIPVIQQIYKEEEGEDFPISEDDLNQINDTKIIHSLLYVTYKDEKVNIYIPVSFTDVYYQLYWYGTDIKIDIENFDFEIVDVEQHPLGSHPTKEEIEAMQEQFKADHEGCMYTTYRDFNQVTLGLIKK